MKRLGKRRMKEFRQLLFSILLQFDLKNKNLAGKKSIRIWILIQLWFWVDGFLFPVLRQALNFMHKAAIDITDKLSLFLTNFNKNLFKNKFLKEAAIFNLHASN